MPLAADLYRQHMIRHFSVRKYVFSDRDEMYMTNGKNKTSITQGFSEGGLEKVSTAVNNEIYKHGDKSS